LPLTGDLIEQLIPPAIAKPYTESLRPLSEEMAKPGPDPGAVQKDSPKVIMALDRCLEELAKKRFDAAEVQQLIDRLDNRGAWDRVASWDEACQRYLALEALRQAWVGLASDRKAEQDGLRIRLERLLGQLMFKEGYDSPQRFDPTGLGTLMAR